MLLISKKRLHCLGPKKGGVVFYVECAKINSELVCDIAPWPYSPCDDTPTAATIAVTTGEFAKYYFYFL